MEDFSEILNTKRIFFARLLEIFQEEGIRLPEDILHEILVCWVDWYWEIELERGLDNLAEAELAQVFESKRIFFERLLKKFGLSMWSPHDVLHQLWVLRYEADELGERINHLGDWVEQFGLRYILELYNQQ